MSRWLLLASLVAGCAGAGSGYRPLPAVDPAEVESSLFLIGDAGAPSARDEPVLRALTTALGNAAGERVVVFLGDNIYPRGLPDSSSSGREEAERRIDAQLDVVAKAGVRAIFVPGNHDWDRMGPDGWNAIRRQAARIAERGDSLIRMLPEDGCPGPVPVDVGTRLRIIALDTQWWLHSGPKPEDRESACRADREDEVADSLRADLERAGEGRHVVVVGHHPLATGGEHGGYFGFRDWLFPLRHAAPWLWVPLPGVGAIYPSFRQGGISNQD
ncbi:MAG TPA: metallophosphoesterase, partial [Gemmatimonadales bacterium]|nr:metallophosphoesterase [Gemmatimonadales bacterium]